MRDLHAGKKKELEAMLKERMRDPSRKEAIDLQILKKFNMKKVVMVTDSVGFSRRTVKYGIIQFLAVLYQVNEHLRKIIVENHGSILSEWADNFIIAFDSPEDAVEAAVAMNKFLVGYNEGKPEEEQFEICIGIGSGEVLFLGNDVFGHEMNCASKLGEDIARAGEILVTETVFQALKDTARFCFEEVSTIKISNILLTYYRILY